jgi:NAD(P) transhydrogenase subunit beta
MELYWSYLAYLASTLLFIFGIKNMAYPRHAIRGNQLAALGMLIAVIATLVHQSILHYQLIVIGILLGSSIGFWIAHKVKMTAMPQMISALNGLGGAASMFVALNHAQVMFLYTDVMVISSIYITIVIGAITLTGSVVAFGKLQGFIPSRSIMIPLHNPLNLIAAFSILYLIGLCIQGFNQGSWLQHLLTISLVLGCMLILPVGGSDMPVVISLLNAYSGLAAAVAGFITQNTVLIIAGSMVGTSGFILTLTMCRSMNRSLLKVFLGNNKRNDIEDLADKIYQGNIAKSSAEEVAMILENAQQVVIVPGFGLASSQAQHAVRELANLLESLNIEVRYAIHPVAGRMPGHMNVLLSEAEIPYEQLVELDQINPQFKETDVVIVIGANDVINPSARIDIKSPIYGMPILNVDEAKQVIVIKRSLKTGYAGLANPLFTCKHTRMLFGDAKKTVTELSQCLKQN